MHFVRKSSAVIGYVRGGWYKNRAPSRQAPSEDDVSLSKALIMASGHVGCVTKYLLYNVKYRTYIYRKNN